MVLNLKKTACAAFAVMMTVTSAGFDSVTTMGASALDVNSATTSQILEDMGIGWNLGNSLDANGGAQNTLEAETSWGNPVTTKALIDAVKDEGFNTVRIPVSWGKHVSGSNYTLDTAWLERVGEIVDYCYDNDMYVILNIHHDNAKAGTANSYYPDSKNKANAEKFVSNIWSQVAEFFKDYDHHLIFETLNEPRLVGTNDEWWFNVNSPNATVADSISVINTLNQDAVNKIRATGSENRDRLIMCPGYAASLDGAVTAGFKMPSDVSGNTNRLVLSVHAYSPYNFAMNTGSGSTKTFTAAIQNELDSIFSTLKNNFTSKGMPVVIGEMGATNKDNAAERYKWADYFTKKAKEQGIVVCLWDNNVYGAGKVSSENFGAIDRSNNKPYDAAYLQHMTALYQKNELSDCTVSDIPSQAYTGREVTPFVTVKNGTKTLVKGTDYTLSYSNNVNVGTATVTITGKGSYSGVLTKNFTIEQKDNNLANSDVSVVSTQSYLGTEITPLFTLKLDGRLLLKGRDYSVVYSDNVNIGTATATITGKGNFTGTKSFTFEIAARANTNVKTPRIIGRQTTPYAAVVSWVPDFTVNGTEVAYSYNQSMTSSKTVTVEGYGINTCAVNNTKGDKVNGYDSSKMLYVKVRSFIYVNGTRTYGSWSEVRTINPLKK